MWIRGHRFSHLKVLDSYCKLMRMEALALFRGGWRLPGQQDGLNNLRFKWQTTRFFVSYVSFITIPLFVFIFFYLD
ncbi:hypothetical protein Hanom_Chr04g00352591 [Helianthus anomalus]